MKKIYLDWNIINHLEDGSELYDCILRNQSHFVFVYSPAHFSDLMKSYKENGDNTYFEEDLKRLEGICETHLMYYTDKKMSVCKCPPTEFLEKEGEVYSTIKDVFNPDYFKNALNLDGVDLYNLFCNGLKSISLGKTIELPFLGSFSNGLELLNCSLAFFEKILTDKVFVKDFRAKTTNDLTNDDITKINGYSPDKIIEKINAYLSKHGCDDGFTEIIKKALQENNQDDEKLIFESLYIGLDLMRFHSDQRDLMNILTDADHAFYGSFCDVLVTDDAKMRSKAKAVYSYLGVDTKIISGKGLKQFLCDELSKENDLDPSLEKLFSNQHIPETYDVDSVYVKWVRLEHPFFSFFNKLEYQFELSSKKEYFVFYRELGFEKCVYFTETEKFFQIIRSTLRNPDVIASFEKEYVEKYKKKDSTARFICHFTPTILLALGVAEEKDFFQPIMVMSFIAEQKE